MKTKYLIILITIFQILRINEVYSQADPSIKSIEVKGIELSYEVYGEGKPVIMLHGFGVDRETMKGCMEPVFQSYNEGWRRVYFDLPGMGQTPASKQINNSDDMLEFVQEFIDQTIPGESFIVVGESYGGYLARALVKDQSDKVEGMLLICPLAVAENSKRDISYSQPIFIDEEFCSSLSMIDNIALSSFATIQDRNTWERLEKEMISGTEKGDALYRAEIRKDENYRLSGKTDKLKVPFSKPCLILTGRQDNLVGYRDTWRFIENYPRASFAVLDMAGHALQIEQTEVFNALVVNWLKRL